MVSSLDSSAQRIFLPLLNELGKERNEEFLLEGLLQIGTRLKSEHQEIPARLLLERLSQGDVSSEIRKRAQQEWDAVIGRGSSVMRMEYLLSGLSAGEDCLKGIAPVLGANMVGQIVGTMFLGKLAGTVSRFWTRGWGASLVSGTASYAAELPVFVALSRAFSPEGGGAFGAGLLPAALGLGVMRGFSFLGNRVVLGLRGLSESGKAVPLEGLAKLAHATLPLGTMFGGLYSLQKLEAKFSLREEIQDATTGVDVLGSMATLLSGLSLGNLILGKSWMKLHQEMEFRSNIFTNYGDTKSNLVFPLEEMAAAGALGRSSLPTMGRSNSITGARYSLDFSDTVSSDGKTEIAGGFSEKKRIELRRYQQRMLENLRRDVAARVSPWLGLASPMQTGKSLLAGPIIQMLMEELGKDVRFIVLSSARVITQQLLGDLEGRFACDIGRFDMIAKKILPITVASVFSMAKHLELFPTDVRTVLLNDEAFFTQSKSYHAIYSHFGLGKIHEEDGRLYLRPKEGNGLVIAFSGTGGGLEGYHLSDQLNLLEAIETGYVRHMRGERVVLTIPSQRKKSTEEVTLSWIPNRSSADALVDIYHKNIYKVYGPSAKVQIWVSLIEQAQLLRDVMRERYGESYAYAVHSKMEQTGDESPLDRDYEKAIVHWQQNGGGLIGVRSIARGFRGLGTDAVFHTYQTSSSELFAQRTGRAWATLDQELPDLYVLEAAWNPRGSFANLARLLGLIDYPGSSVESRKIKPILKDIQKRQRQQRELEEAIACGKVTQVFAGIPLEEGWRRIFMNLAVREKGIPRLVGKTGMQDEILAGFALGALPTCWDHVLHLAELLGGESAAKRIWVESWERAIDDILGGRQKLYDLLESDLLAWKESLSTQNPAGLDAAASSLNEILLRRLPYLKALARRQRRIQVTQADLLQLQKGFSAFCRVFSDGSSPLSGVTSAEILEKVQLNTLSDAEWRRIWLGLAQAWNRRSQDPVVSGTERRIAGGQLRALLTHFFHREGWETNPTTDRERLRYQARRAVALKFGAMLPLYSGIEGIGQHQVALIQRWLSGENPELRHTMPPNRLYRQVRQLFIGIGTPESLVNIWIVNAIFEKRKWSLKAQTAKEKLLTETRYWVARESGGSLPGGDEWGVVSDWVQTGRISKLHQEDPAEFYPLLTRLLLDLGAEPLDILPKVYLSVAEEYAGFIEKMEKDEWRIKYHYSKPSRSIKEWTDVKGSYLATLHWLIGEHGHAFPQAQFLAPLMREAMISSSEKPSNPFRETAFGQLQKETRRILKTLKPREERAVRIRLGMDGGDEMSTEGMALKLKRSRAAVDLIEAKALNWRALSLRALNWRALKKLRHPSRSQVLKDFMDLD